MNNKIQAFFTSSNKIFNLIITVTICIVLLMNYGCSKIVYPMSWQATPVIADGDLKDWNLPLQYYDEDSRLNYSMSNDDKNLYICVRAGDQQSQFKMIRAGFNVWIDTTGKKNQTVGIRFPLDEKLLPHHSPIQHEKGRKQDMNELMSKMVLEQSQMQLLGFKNAGNGVSPLRNESGIAAAIKWDSTGVLAYEAVIPFKTFYKDNLTSSSISKIWTICFVLNGIEQVSDKKDSGDNAGNGGGRGGGGMGGGGGMRGGGGGMRGGGGGHGGGQNPGLSESNTIRNYVHLTLK